MLKIVVLSYARLILETVLALEAQTQMVVFQEKCLTLKYNKYQAI